MSEQIKLGGPVNFYHPNTDTKKLGLDKAAEAINQNTAVNERQTQKITEINGQIVELAGKVSELDTIPDMIADAYDGSYSERPGESYAQYDGCEYLGVKYICSKWQGTTTGEWSASDWNPATQVTLDIWGKSVGEYEYIELNGKLWTPHRSVAVLSGTSFTDEQIEAAGFGVVTFDEYAGTPSIIWGTTYEPGDHVIYNGALYRCDDETGGTWDPNAWTAVQVTKEIEDINPGSTVTPNPGGTATSTLTSLGIDGDVYEIATGTTVEANPPGTATADLTKIEIGSNIYDIPTSLINIVDEWEVGSAPLTSFTPTGIKIGSKDLYALRITTNNTFASSISVNTRNSNTEFVGLSFYSKDLSNINNPIHYGGPSDELDIEEILDSNGNVIFEIRASWNSNYNAFFGTLFWAA